MPGVVKTLVVKTLVVKTLVVKTLVLHKVCLWDAFCQVRREHILTEKRTHSNREENIF